MSAFPRKAVLCVGAALWLNCALPFNNNVHAADVRFIDVAHEKGEYKVSFEVLLSADYEKVWNLLKTHQRLREISPAITRKDIKTSASGETILDIDLNACWLWFCKTLNKVSHVDASVAGRLSYRVTEDARSFSVADETLTLSREAASTKLSYEARLVPSIFIPPLIGPYAISKIIESELRISAANTERLANE